MELNREVTWEPPPSMPPEEVDRICGWDHKRIYGQDFGAKLQVTSVMYGPELVDKHRLYDEPIYFVTRSPAVFATIKRKLQGASADRVN